MARARTAVGSIVVVLALVGCGQGKTRVVSDAAEKTFFQVPRSWTSFTMPTGVADRLQPLYQEDVSTVWDVVFDSAAEPDPGRAALLDDLDVAELDQPVGRAMVYEVTGSFAQRLSLSSARESVIGADPLFIGDDLADLWEIVDYEPAKGDRLEGSRVVFNFRRSVNEPWQTYDVTTLFDQSASRMYVLRVACSAKCFDANKNRIFDVTTSWTVNR